MGSSSSHYITLVLLLCLNCQPLASAWSPFIFFKYHINLLNSIRDSSTTLDIHCWSNTGDTGLLHIPFGGSYNWSFKPTPWYSSPAEYNCNALWGNSTKGGSLVFLAFLDRKNFVDDKCGGRHCIWLADNTGFSLYNIKHNSWNFMYGWKPRTAELESEKPRALEVGDHLL